MWTDKIEKYVAVSGLPGIHKINSSRSNGLLIENMDTGKTKFISMRKHQFTPLATVSIYTEDDTRELTKVFQSMLDQYEDNPPPATNAAASDLFEYFEDILPTYDKDQVFIGDVKKVIKWFNFLRDRKFFEDTEPSAEEV
jgi:hypothetical protein